MLSSGTTSRPHISVEKSRSTKIHHKHHKRLRYPVLGKTTYLNLNTIITEKIPNTNFSTDGPRNYKNDSTKDHSKIRLQNWIPLKNVLNTKVRRTMETSLQLEKTQRICQVTKVPIGKPSKTTILLTKRRLYGENRPIPGLSACTNNKKALALPSVTLPQFNLRTNGTSIWPEFRTSNICKNNKLGCQVTQKTEHTINRVPRRLFNSESKPTASGKRSVNSYKDPHKSGLQNKLGKVSAKPNKRNNVPRNKLEYRIESKKPASTKNTITRKNHPKNHKKRKMELATSKVDFGQNGICIVRHTASSTALSKNSTIREPVTGIDAQLTHQNKTRYYSRVAMVAGKLRTKVKDNSERTGNPPSHRRLKLGLGSRVRRRTDLRTMERLPKEMAYKQERNVCGLQNFVQLPDNTTEQKYPYTMRQQNGGRLHKKSGWNQIGITPKTCRRHLEYGNTQRYRHTNRTYSRSLQHNIRSSVQRQKVTRLAPIERDTENDFRKMGHSMHRPIRNTKIGSSPKIRHAISMPTGRICERIHKDVGLQIRMDIPPATVNTQDPTSSQPMSRDLHINSSPMGECLLAAATQEKICRQTIHNTESSRPFDRPSNQPTPSQNTRFVLGSMESTGWADLVKNWSIKEKQILETSWRKSSLGTYSAAWKSWCLWAKDKKVSINNPNPTEVAQYLCYLYYKKKMSYRTIYLHKSTIATFSNPLNSDKISSNPLIKHTLKGIANTNPQTLRTKIWDVNKLLTWIRHNPPDPSNLFQVSRHLAILLLLSSGRRIHDLTLLRIDTDFLEQSENEVIFWPQYGSKTDKWKNIQSGWKLLKNDQELWDIVNWVKKYIDISHSRRHANNQKIPYLFLKTRGKTGPASRSVIAGWVRTALLSAGIEAGAGSTRSAVATYRFNSCLPLDEVLKRGNWQGPNNFFKHYYREIEKSATSEMYINNRNMITESFVPL